MHQQDALTAAPGDVLVTPGAGDFLIGRISRDGRSWEALDVTPTLAAALRKAQMHGVARGVRVLVSRTGESLELFDPKRLWLEADRRWIDHDRQFILREVPPAAGVYVIRAVTPILVGDTDNLRERLLYHIGERGRCDAARDASLQFCFDVVESSDERAARVADLVSWWSPPCNQLA